MKFSVLKNSNFRKLLSANMILQTGKMTKRKKKRKKTNPF